MPTSWHSMERGLQLAQTAVQHFSRAPMQDATRSSILEFNSSRQSNPQQTSPNRAIPWDQDPRLQPGVCAYCPNSSLTGCPFFACQYCCIRCGGPCQYHEWLDHHHTRTVVQGDYSQVRQTDVATSPNPRSESERSVTRRLIHTVPDRIGLSGSPLQFIFDDASPAHESNRTFPQR